MRSYRRASVMAATGLLFVVAPLAAARAGATLAPTAAPATAGVPPEAMTTTTDARAGARSDTSAFRGIVPAARTRARVERGRVVARRPRAAVRSMSTTTTRPPAPLPTTNAPTAPTPPTDCASVVASIAWPEGWHTQCDGPRSEVLGLTDPDGTTTVYVRSGESVEMLEVVARHEAGHAWDFARLDPPKIALWCARRGCDAANFFRGGWNPAGWGEPPGAEDWASAWNACHGGRYDRSYLGLPAPTSDLCALQDALVR